MTEQLFHEVYNSYYRAMEKLLQEAQQGTLSQGRTAELCAGTAFAESFLYICEAIKKEQWQVITKDFQTPLRHQPKRPTTGLERQWIAAVKLDRRMQLFLQWETEGGEEASAEAGEAPLYRPEDFFTTDSVRDGDPYEDTRYQRVFQTVVNAIGRGTKLRVCYVRGKGAEEKRSLVWPCRLEYSEKDDKFRLLAKDGRGAVILNLARIRSCVPEGEEGEGPGPGGNKPPEFRPRKNKVILELMDQRNAMERCLIHFADLEKKTEKLGERLYRIELSYRREDETEILIRVLSFGPFLRAVGPDSFVTQVKERLTRQLTLGQQGRGEGMEW